jgi:pimeloyl-ACP methyl ester carboxylesterase
MAKDTIPKGYADTQFGQVHYRLLRGGPCALVLIHWLPLSSRMYAHIMPALADAGFTVLAVDLLGYGRSDPRPAAWSMAQWGDTVMDAASALGIERAGVLGGHSGACVATEIALNHPHRVSHLILDGCALPTPELRATFAKMGAAPRPTPQEDGAHESLIWRTAHGMIKHYIPDYAPERDGLERIWPAMLDYLETDFVSSAPISGPYDLGARLPELIGPTLLLGAEKDTLAASFPVARTLAPGAAHHFFQGDHPIHFPARAAEYVAPIVSFLHAHQEQT